MSRGAPARHVAVIGAGPMGLAAAHDLARGGAEVTLFERDDRIGGMSAHVDFAGTRIERYYHFVCAPDTTTFHWLRAFGLEDRLRWRRTHMGFYCAGTLHDWGGPGALLRFPGLSWAQKLRYAAHVIRAKSITDWRPYDRISSTAWLQRWIGRDAYDVVWKSLFHYKFYEYQDSLSAAWLGTRIKRVALSRKNVFEERLGYIEGGSEVLLDAIAERLRGLGARIELGAQVEEILATPYASGSRARIRGVRVNGTECAFDAVVSTIPLPHLARVAPCLPPDEAARIAAVRNVGVVCVLLKLRRPFTRNFWLNINDPRIEIPGLVEYTNLNPLDGNAAVVYAPFYMPQTHAKFGRDAQAFIDETVAAMQLIKPDWNRSDVIAATASRYAYAQTVCTPGFFDALPPMKSALSGLVLADTSHYYPEDRSISESLRIGSLLATLVMEAS